MTNIVTQKNNICNSKLIESIALIEDFLGALDTKPSINIELEGVYDDNQNLAKNEFYKKVNLRLNELEIKAKLKPEFWKNQWEYESDLQIGNTAEVIDGYQKFFTNIDQIFSPQIPKIEPISYDWQKVEGRKIHVPNALQINLSLWKEGFNLLSDRNYAIFLQNLLIKNSIGNLIFFIPNQESLDRLLLKEKYLLQDKLMSPHDISGGNQGSIACYLEKNKKNLPNNLDLNFDNLSYKTSDHECDWQKNARIEFRLASTSVEYRLELHILFVMIIILESVILYQKDVKYEEIKDSYQLPEKFYHHKDDNIVSRYQNSSFFKDKIALFSKKQQKKEFLALSNLLPLVESEMDNFIKCIKS